jgi:hypothetical protein
MERAIIIVSLALSVAGLGYCKNTKAQTVGITATNPYASSIYIDQVGDLNNITVSQDGPGHSATITTGANTNVDYATLSILQQGTGAKTATIDVKGGVNNSANIQQDGNGNHTANVQIFSGNGNSANITQTGAANHIADVKLTGNGNSATVNQSGNQQNRANIDLTNVLGPASVDLTQTGGQSFTIQQFCMNPSGCSTTVRQ